MAILTASGITKAYGNLQVLKGVSLEIKASEVVSIVGASGAGKSTLLQILGTLDTADAGQLIIDGTDLNQLGSAQMAKFRNAKLGFVFQAHNLLPEFTALENICLPGFIAGKQQQVVEREARELLKMLGLTDRQDHKPAALSGGEQQRVAVARALINKPQIVFADEPSGNLDTANAEQLHNLFFTLRQELGQTFIIVTHNMAFAQSADRMLTMKDGDILTESVS